MKWARQAALVGCAGALLATGASGQETGAVVPEAMKRLLDCRAVREDAARLACYDTQAATVSASVEKKELVVADRAQVAKAKRSLFGLTLPQLDIFGSGDPKEEAVERIESTIKRAVKRADGRWLFLLDDGAKWAQADSRELTREAKPGMPIVIRRAAMGSFLANVDGQIAIRVRREN